MLKSIFDLISFRKNKRLEQFNELIAHYFNIDKSNVFFYGAGRMGVYEVLKALNFSSKDEVIVAGYTCVVLTNVVEFVGCKIKYVDISTNSLTIDSNILFKSISENTKAIIIPHNFGILYEEIDEIKKRFPSIIIIEDSAHAFGSKFKDGTLAGLKGDAAFFSMEFSKPLSTGLGGVLLINNDALLDEVKKSYTKVPYFSSSVVFKIFLTFMVMNLTIWRKSNFFFILIITFMRKVGLLYSTSNEEIYGKKPADYPVKLSPSLSIFGYYQLKDINPILKQKHEIAKLYNDAFSQFKQIHQFYKPNYIYVRYPLVFSEDIDSLTIEKIKKEAELNGLVLGDWFNDVVHPYGLYRFGYSTNQCMIGEMVSKKIVNTPININVKPKKEELDILKEIFINNGIS